MEVVHLINMYSGVEGGKKEEGVSGIYCQLKENF